MYFDSWCDSSVRFAERLYCSLRCQLSNTDHGLPDFENKKKKKKIRILLEEKKNTFNDNCCCLLTEKNQFQIEAKTFAEEIRFTDQWQFNGGLNKILIHHSYHVVFESVTEDEMDFFFFFFPFEISFAHLKIRW